MTIFGPKPPTWPTVGIPPLPLDIRRPGLRRRALPLRHGAGADLFRKTLDWALADVSQPHTAAQLAARACMSERTFTRRFRLETGVTVYHWLLDRRLLELNEQTIEVIADRTGYGTSSALRKRFGKQLKMSPSARRRRRRP